MASYLVPLLEAIEDIIEANYNTELAAIDANVPTLNSDSIKIQDYFIPEEQFPFVYIFPFTESEIATDEPGDLLLFNWRVVTAVSIAVSSSTQGITELDTYTTALMKTVIKGTTGVWCLDGNARLVRPFSIGHDAFEGRTEEEIIKSGFILWDVLDENDPTT